MSTNETKFYDDGAFTGTNKSTVCITCLYSVFCQWNWNGTAHFCTTCRL